MKKIYIILIITLFIRLVHINFPVSGWHSWRQSDTASIARNFYEKGFNILYPQINWAPQTTGYVESEFHIYPFIVSLLYSVFGIDDMWGRVVSVIFSLFAVYVLYLLVKKLINENTAFWSAIIYGILPLNIFYSRAFMPESTMLMCSICSVYFFSEWLDKEKPKYFIYAWIFTSLAVLIKLPSLYIGLPLAYLAFQKYRSALFLNFKIYLLTFLILIPAILWYYHAHQLFLNGGVSFGIWTYGEDKWGMFSLLLQPEVYNDIFLKSFAERHVTYPGFILLIWGLFLKRKYGREKLFDFWLIAVIVFILIAVQAHRAQEYYTLPLNIPASVFIGKVFAKYVPASDFRKNFSKNKFVSGIVFLCLILICALSYFRIANFMKSEQWESPLFKIAEDIKTYTNNEDLVITISNGNPVYLYQSHRKGWNAMPEQIDSTFLKNKKLLGAKFLAGEKNIFLRHDAVKNLDYILKNHTIIKDNEDYFIVKLN